MADKIDIKARVAELLLEELKSSGPEEWYYISVVHVPTGTFYGGYFLQAKGPTDAWVRMHALKWCPPDCKTETSGPFPEENVALKVPQSDRYRRLSKEEMKAYQ